MPLDKVLYTAKTQTTGGRDGASHSDDGRLAVKLSSPGTPGSGTNPEQLFAAGWSACFLSAIKLVAGQRRSLIRAISPSTLRLTLASHTVFTVFRLDWMSLCRDWTGKRDSRLPPRLSRLLEVKYSV